MQDRAHADQQERAQGLNLVVAAIILWNTLELERIIAELRAEGRVISEELLRHLSPMDWEHISLTGEYFWEAFAERQAKARRHRNGTPSVEEK